MSSPNEIAEFSPGAVETGNTGRTDTPGTVYTLPGSPDLRQLENPQSGSWLNYRKTLRPRFGVAWAELIFCLLMVLAGFGTHAALTRWRGNAFGFQIGIVFAIWIGFWLNAVLTFGHEAAHYNLSSDRQRNDVLADWTIWLFFPQSTSSYRRSHWQHHAHLGDPQDTEISYHNCLSPWFLAKTLTGVHLMLLLWRYVFGKKPAGMASGSSRQQMEILPPVRALATHAILVSGAILMGCYATAITWLVGAALFFPFFASMRQLLEHRSQEAACQTDFSKVNHGPVNRMFGQDVISRYFGAAGFNRHLLHHWDPTVSYTRFDEMQHYFMETEHRQAIEQARFSYWSACAVLLKRALDSYR